MRIVWESSTFLPPFSQSVSQKKEDLIKRAAVLLKGGVRQERRVRRQERVSPSLCVVSVSKTDMKKGFGPSQSPGGCVQCDD